MKVLVVDIGGTHVKCLATGEEAARKFDSGARLTPQRMVEGVLRITSDWRFDALTLGYPGVVHGGVPAREPHNLGVGWVGYDYEAAFGRPVKILNDAAMQALGSYEGGRMLFLGLGTGLGSALIIDGAVVPMELGHLHCRKGRSYEDFLGKQGFERLGRKKWRRKVRAVVRGFQDALLPDEVVIGGGQVELLDRLPEHTRRGANAAAFAGGFKVWASAVPGAEKNEAPGPAGARRPPQKVHGFAA